MSSIYTMVSAPPTSYPAPSRTPGGKSAPGNYNYGNAERYREQRSKLGYKTAFKHTGYGGMTAAMKRAEQESHRHRYNCTL